MDTIKKLHGRLVVTGFHTDASAISRVLSEYALSAAGFNNARLVFGEIQYPNTFSFNTMIRGSSQSEEPVEALFFYNQMRQKGLAQNHLSFLFILKACERIGQILSGKKVHSDILKLGFCSHLFVSNALIHMYAYCGDLELAHKVFDETPDRDLVSWNSLICGYAQNNRMRKVLELFEAMQTQGVTADAVTLVKVVLACSHLEDWEMTDRVDKYIEDYNVKTDIYLGNTLIDLYGRRGRIDLARRVFDGMSTRNLITYNTMIMSCTRVGDLASALKLFNEMPGRDAISWSSIIAGCSKTKQYTKAVELFNRMLIDRVEPDEITLASVLSACSNLGALDVGKGIHDYIRQKNVKADIYIWNSLINMYCKCGSIREALEVFEEMGEKDTVTWTSVITGMAVNGFANDALEFFSRMISTGISPSSTTFIAVLHACTQNGFVDKGLEYFQSMSKYRIEPEMKHYGCTVDLLSRSGKLDEARDFIEKMPVSPDPVIWRMLLSACKHYGNVDMAEMVTAKLLNTDPSNSGNYVLMSTAYAGADRWDDSARLRSLMEDTDVEKAPASSYINLDNIQQEIKLWKK